MHQIEVQELFARLTSQFEDAAALATEGQRVGLAPQAAVRLLMDIRGKRLNIGVAHEVSIPDFERRIGLPRGTGGKPFEAYLAIKQDEAVKAEVQALLVRLKEPARYADVAAPECDAAAFVTDLLDQLRKRAAEHGWEDSFRLGE